jgi:hypothetical protein
LEWNVVFNLYAKEITVWISGTEGSLAMRISKSEFGRDVELDRKGEKGYLEL